MRRIWVDPQQIKGLQFELEDEAFHHAIKVSRFKIGEEFEVVSGTGEALRVKLEDVKKRSALVKVLSRRELAKLQKPFVSLAFAIPKWSTFEEVVEKSVELGVHTLQPLITEFSSARTKKDVTEARTERWKKINQAATEQSARGELMRICEPLTLQEFVGGLNLKGPDLCLFAYEGPATLAVKTELQRHPLQDKEQIWALVGAEGGFSEKEAEFLKGQSLPPVTLGKQILRAETACLAMVSVIKYESNGLR